MARVLAQSINVAGPVAGQRVAQHQGSGKSKRSANMMCTLPATGLRMTGFSGLSTVNPLDTIWRPAQDFHSKLSIATSSRRGRASRCVPKAMRWIFNEKAIEVITLAEEEARRLGHNFIGTEQILLGLIREDTSIAAKVLKSMGVNLEDAGVEVEKIIGRGSGIVAAEIPYTPAAKRVLKLSLEEASQFGQYYIGPEHLLLGLLREGECVAALVLENLGADPTKIRTQAIRMVCGESSDSFTAIVAPGSSGKKMPTLEAKAEGLAQRIANGDLPETIEGKKVISKTLDLGLLVAAGTEYRGESKERFKKLMEETKPRDDEIIIFTVEF